MNDKPNILDVSNLTIDVFREGSWLPAVKDLSFTIAHGETLSLVGESGSGKTLTALAIGRLLPRGSRIAFGKVLFLGKELTSLGENELREIRGRQLSYVFQDPTSALDPTMTIGRQICEALEAHGVGTRAERRERARELLSLVEIPDSQGGLNSLPHEFSGGMRQRVMIASALAATPTLLIADEPTSSLDVTIQAQILSLLQQLSRDMDLAMLFITHDLAVARTISQRTAVMYAGRVLESGPTELILHSPHHPYSRALVSLAPQRKTLLRLPEPIPGKPTPAWETGHGCPFAGRCKYAEERCSRKTFVLQSVSQENRHLSACIILPENRTERAFSAYR